MLYYIHTKEPDMRSYLILLAVVSLCAGCATMHEPELTADQVRQIDLATGDQTATVLVKARPAGQQQLTTFYQIDIPDLEPVLVFKESNTVLRLDAGTVPVTITAVTGKDKFAARGDFFGKPSRRVLNLKPGDRVILEYTGPYWMGDSGRLYAK